MHTFIHSLMQYFKYIMKRNRSYKKKKVFEDMLILVITVYVRLKKKQSNAGCNDNKSKTNRK